MKHYIIRFNKSRGKPGRGTLDHAWRVFEDKKEYLFKHLQINVPVRDEVTSSPEGQDWNISCDGILTIDRETSTAIINRE